MLKFKHIFKNHLSIIGMIHVGALPGTPFYQGSVQKLIDNACLETELYLKHNLDGLLVENMHDLPYVQAMYFLPETTATMTRICFEVRKLIPKNIPCGVQVLACGNKEAIAIAQAADLSFIRAESYVFSHVADEGFTDACAGNILRYRKQIEADNVLVFTDIKKKHSSHAITTDVSLVETGKAAEFFMSDGLIITGTSTGSATDPNELHDLKKSSTLPIIIGSGVTKENVIQYTNADALIIGSYFKSNGHWKNELSNVRINDFMEEIKCLRAKCK